MKQYRVIVTLKAPFNESVEMPYGPAQPDRFKTLAQLVSALDAHDSPYNQTLNIRVEITNETCWCGGLAEFVVPVDPQVSNPDCEMSDGEPGLLVCEEHLTDGYERIGR